MTCYEKNGWIYVSIKGEPEQRGYDYGLCVAERMKKVFEMMQFNCLTNYGYEWKYFIDLSDKYLFDIIKKDFKEFFDEMTGFTNGCIAGGTSTNIHEIVAWNNMISLMDYVHPYATGVKDGARDRCSSFIACGDYTKDGGIVLCHSNFSEFIEGQFANVVLDIQPTKGNRILLQGFVGWMWSGTDFFVTSAGIIGAESTLGGFYKYKENNYPISCRIRQCMQYGNSLDDYLEILQKGNAGDYANAWFFGNIKTNEIMMIELGLEYVSVKRKTNGYFIGMNAAYDPRIRNLECKNTGIDDVRRHQGARKVRLPQLMEEYKGRIDETTAKAMIADHYDVYLHKNNPCSRTVCAHYELDPREFMSQESRPLPFAARGAVDGCIITSKLAKQMKFLLRWGNSCGIPFIVSEFCEKHPQWAFMKNYLEDRPPQEWTEFSITKKKTRKKH
uniref:Uncharacterized protein n=1 Tax=viral metagenome TaxID=1070528 RepID=A0A6C0HSD0_9ZZZZ